MVKCQSHVLMLCFCFYMYYIYYPLETVIHIEKLRDTTLCRISTGSEVTLSKLKVASFALYEKVLKSYIISIGSISLTLLIGRDNKIVILYFMYIYQIISLT